MRLALGNKTVYSWVAANHSPTPPIVSAPATKSTRTTKINTPTLTSGRKYSMQAPHPSLPPSPSQRGRLQPQNIFLVLLLRHAQRDRTIRGTGDELLHERVGRLTNLVWRAGRDNTATMQHDHFIGDTK